MPGALGVTRHLKMTRYANWQSDEVEGLVFVGSTPTQADFLDARPVLTES